MLNSRNKLAADPDAFTSAYIFGRKTVAGRAEATKPVNPPQLKDEPEADVSRRLLWKLHQQDSELLIDGTRGFTQFLTNVEGTDLGNPFETMLDRLHSKTLVQCFAHPALLNLYSEHGTWLSDGFAEHLHTADEHEESAIFRTRLIVYLACRRAKRRLDKERGINELKCAIRNMKQIKKFSALSAASYQVAEEHPDFWLGFVEERLRTHAVHCELHAAALEGRPPEIEQFDRMSLSELAVGYRKGGPVTGVDEFIRHLAVGWWKCTGKRPQKSQRHYAKCPLRNSFVRFANAAFTDCATTETDTLSRRVRSVLTQFEKKNAPWRREICQP